MRGKVSLHSYICPLKRDHPRLCGEKPYASKSAEQPKGSPPPMRGKGTPRQPNTRSSGITPAYAGKSYYVPLWVPTRAGSPPPMRGKEVIPGKIAKPYRITPAYAGKRHALRRLSRCCRDHPRLCGEKQALRALQQCLEGSPPPMRGKVVLYVVLQIWDRITPAYAGKRQSSFYAWYTGGDHPRLCGEKYRGGRTTSKNMGSPPPMRGKADVVNAFNTGGRITPAYAGKRIENPIPMKIFKDHPRLCGEKSARILCWSTTSRITPAYAGKSRSKCLF